MLQGKQEILFVMDPLPDYIVEKTKEYAIKMHESVNQMYGDKPYAVHLQMVYEYGLKYDYLIEPSLKSFVLASCWTHDLIEDCRLTYNDVKEKLGFTIAEITYALTNEKGKTRKERANEKYYDGIKSCPGATFVKCCDRLANIKYSKNSGSNMLNAYKKEHAHFKTMLYSEKHKDMFLEMENFLFL